MIVAVEPSGDALGADLLAALRSRLDQGARFIGVGGPRMAQGGVESRFSIEGLAILGVFNAIAALPLVRRRVGETVRLAANEKPDAVVLIDSWGFSLRVARGLRR